MKRNKRVKCEEKAAVVVSFEGQKEIPMCRSHEKVLEEYLNFCGQYLIFTTRAAKPDEKCAVIIKKREKRGVKKFNKISQKVAYREIEE